MKATNVNKLVDAGCIFIFWVADWFALLNLKMWGDLDKIRTVGRYFVEVWKAVGMKMSNVKFLWCSDHITRDAAKYWMNVMDISKTFTISRLLKCCQALGRSESTSLKTSQIMYPCMQATDIFFLKTDICQLG